jgi:GTPase SAR1 family protein
MKDELDRLRDEVLGLFPRIEAKLGADLSAEQREPLRRGRAELADSSYLVLVVGEFKRGKSSLLNALIEQDMFPVDPDVATSTVCTLRWGDTPQAQVYFLPGTGDDEVAPPPKSIGLDEIPRYASEQGRAEGDPPVAQIDITAPIAQLQSGLILVDTPGVGSLNPEHTAATSSFLPEADALLFVASAVQPLGTVELAFLARAYEVCPIVLTAVTKIDQAVDWDEVLAQTRDKIASVTGLPVGEVDLVGVSARRKREGLKRQDQATIQESGFPALAERLWTGLVASCATARLSQAVEVLDAVASDCEAPLQNEKAGLTDDQALSDLDEELKAAQVRAQEARASAPRRSRALADDLEERSQPVRRRLDLAFEEISTEFKQAIENRAVLAQPEAAVNQLVRAMVEARTAANRDLTKVVEEVAARFAEELSIRLTGLGQETEGGAIKISAPHITMPSRRFATFRTVWGGATAAGAAGLVAGGLLAFIFPPAAMAIGPFVAGPLIGGLLGQLTGVVGGMGQARTQNRDREDSERRRVLRDHVLPKIESIRRASIDDLNQRQRAESKALVREIEEQLALTASSLDESRARLQQARARTAADNAARLRQVERRLEDYEEIYEVLAEMRHRLEGLQPGGDPR